jgi:hypothetical protein
VARRSITQKKVARLRKAINRKPLPAFINLVHWLKLHGYAQTSGEADRLILAGKVRAGANKVGFEKVPVRTPDGKVVDQDVVRAIIPAALGPDLMVLP